MPALPASHHHELASTYFIQSQHTKQELTRLTLQDRLLTTQMGGLLPEQPDPTRFQHVLDVGCGTGDWLLQLASISPSTSGVGIDINPYMVQYARFRAAHHSLSERVVFQVMDALSPLAFSDNSFDLVNLRLGISFVRTWEWPHLLVELLRVTRPGGTIRLTEPEVLHSSSSPALTRLGEIFLCAFTRAGHLFAPTSTGLTAHLAPLLHQFGYVQVQQQAFPLRLSAGTEAGQSYAENAAALLKAVRPFLERRGCVSSDYDELYQQVLNEIQQPDFEVTWTFHIVWGQIRLASTSSANE